MQVVRMPNGKVCRLNRDGSIATKVDLDLTEVLGVTEASFAELLAERVAGARVLANVTYALVGHYGTGLTFEVRGTPMPNSCVDQIDLDSLEEVEFEASVTRIGYGVRTFRLSARTEEDAIDMADDDAGNHLYSEHCSEYQVEVYRVS